jgi:hypothetical protein
MYVPYSFRYRKVVCPEPHNIRDCSVSPGSVDLEALDRKVRHFEWHTLEKKTYFLTLYDTSLIYVGQTTDIRQRLKEHMKLVNTWAHVFCEGFFLDTLQPDLVIVATSDIAESLFHAFFAESSIFGYRNASKGWFRVTSRVESVLRYIAKYGDAPSSDLWHEMFV